MTKYIRSLQNQNINNQQYPNNNNNLLFTNNKLKPLLNLQIYSNADTRTYNNYNQPFEEPVIGHHKPQYGESKYTSSLYVGKMHKLRGLY
jgi:hypothetical protein